MASRVIRAHRPTHHVKGQHLGRRCKYFILPFFVNVASFLKSNCQNWFRIYSDINRVLYLVYKCFLFLPVNRIKTETGTSILIPSNNEHSNVLRIEGSPKGVALAKEEILQMVKKLVSKTSPQVFLIICYILLSNYLFLCRWMKERLLVSIVTKDLFPPTPWLSLQWLLHGCCLTPLLSQHFALREK